MFNDKKNILFDLDGTIIDSHDGVINCFIETLEHFGHIPPMKEDLSWCIGPPLFYSYNILVPGKDIEYIEELVRYNRKIYGEKWVFHCKIFAGMGELITQLASHKTLYTATAKPQIFAEEILAKLNIDHYFTKIYGSGIDGSLENKIELVKHIIIKENISPEESILIGDTKFDIVAAQGNNMDVIAVRWGYAQKNELEDNHPSVICHDIAQLARLISSSPR